MLEGPIETTRQMLELENLTVDDIDLFEIHEAYATVVMSWWKNNPDVPEERLNIHGGAISQGHPFGASGTRQLAHLAHTMANRDMKVGLQAMCCGGGIGTGTILVRD
jgi:acetyl-CoA acetyltransferase